MEEKERIKRRRKRMKQKRQERILKCAIYLVCVMFVLLIIFIFLTQTDDLKGLWAIDSVTSYRFDGNGHGALLLPDVEYPFSYAISGSNLSIDFEKDNISDRTYELILSKSQITLINRDGKEAVEYKLTRKQ